ncbi:hypothetical protein D9M71_312560 [compost metagenome]
MVGRQAVVARDQRAGALVGQLLGVRLDRQSVARGGGEHPFALRRAEGDVLAEHVYRIGQPLGGGCRDHLRADQLDVGIAAAGVLLRQGVGAEQGGDHPYRQFRAEAAGDAQDLQLVLEGEAVAGLDLHGGHAVGEQRFEARAGQGEQLVLGGGAGGAHGAEDAAAGAGDLGVAGALKTLLELAGAVAGVHQVGVAVDQPGGQQPAAPGQAGAGDAGFVQLGHRAEQGDAAVLDQHGHRRGQLLQAVEDADVAPQQALVGKCGHGWMTFGWRCLYIQYERGRRPSSIAIAVGPASRPGAGRETPRCPDVPRL